MHPASTTPYACDHCSRAVYPDSLSSGVLELDPTGRWRWHTCQPIVAPAPSCDALEPKRSGHRGSWFGGATR